MPEYKITTPQGTFKVTAPDEDTALQALEEQGMMAPKEGVVEDVGRSLGSGVIQGAESGLGMFGDAAKAQGDVVGWLAGKLGASPETAGSIGNFASYLTPGALLPSTDLVRNVTRPAMRAAGVEGAATYEPKTLGGKFAHTIGEFAPSAAAGPGSLLRKGAMAVVPGAMSEAAGQAVEMVAGEGSAAEPWARTGAAVLGGGLAAGVKPNPVKQAAKGAPSSEALADEVNETYRQLRAHGIEYSPAAYDNMVMDTARELKKLGFRPVGKVKEAFEWVEEMVKGMGRSPDFDDINSLRSQIGDASRDAYRTPGGQSLGKALDVVRDKLDDFEGAAPYTSKTTLPPEELDRLRSAGRAGALKRIKERAIQEVVDKSDAYSAGREAGIRSGLDNLLRSKRGLQLFSGAEREALLDISQGRKLGQAAAKLGFSGTRGSGNAVFTPLLAALGLNALFGPVVAGAVGATGAVMKPIQAARARAGVERAAAAIRSGKLQDGKAIGASKIEQKKAFIRAMLAADAAHRGQLTSQ